MSDGGTLQDWRFDTETDRRKLQQQARRELEFSGMRDSGFPFPPEQDSMYEIADCLALGLANLPPEQQKVVIDSLPTMSRGMPFRLLVCGLLELRIK